VKREALDVGGKEVGSLSDIAVRDEAKEVRPDAGPQARKYRRCIRWNTVRIFLGRERRRRSWIVRRSRTVNVGQAPRRVVSRFTYHV
jgi:hypothetical protein